MKGSYERKQMNIMGRQRLNIPLYTQARCKSDHFVIRRAANICHSRGAQIAPFQQKNLIEDDPNVIGESWCTYSYDDILGSIIFGNWQNPMVPQN